MIEKRISNQFLDESKVIKAKDDVELEIRIKKQKQQWKDKEKIERLKLQANIQTEAATSIIEEFRSLLLSSLRTNHSINWLKQFDKEFSLVEPKLEYYHNLINVPKEDKLFEFLLSSIRRRRKEKEREANLLFQQAYSQYLLEKNLFENEKENHDKKLNRFKKSFEDGNPDAIEKYFSMVLDNSKYPDGFNKEFSLGYIPETKHIVIEFKLPSQDDVPKISEYKFIKTRKEIDVKKMSNEEFKKFFEDVIFQITLRTIYEVVQTDYPNFIDNIVFNGWIHGIDFATGNEYDSRIISIQVKKIEFLSLRLENVNPKDCFRKLNGISTASLHHLSPVKPILELNKEDDRFIEKRDVLSEIELIPNIADMEWEDFEHLVCNFFEVYFKEKGEVKITQKSREGGIDGVIFDNDPISGGKYLIQAKKYNDIVPPAAVRELGGAIHHERAARGILITTAYFGPDSKTWANDNNITLIDGQQFVFLLNEYGYKVRCQIKKEKKI